MSVTARPLLRRSSRAALLLFTVTASGCLGNLGRAPTESATGEAFGLEAEAQRTRIAAQNVETSLLGMIEVSADRIIAETDDRNVARNALRWKTTAIPVVQRAAHHPDPLISFIDEWVLIIQMREYFESGLGQGLFGDQQHIAIDALSDAEAQLDRGTGEVVDSTTYQVVQQFARNWAREYPVDNFLFVRPPVSRIAADALGSTQRGGLDALGRLEELAFDAQQMAQSYAAYTPKVALWQAQLMVEEMLDTAALGSLVGQVDQLEVTMAATALMEEFPELLRSERAATTADISALTEASLTTLVGLAARERQMVLEEVARLVRAERSALTDDVAEALIRTLEEGRDEAIVVIDHTLWRIAQMAAALIILLALIQYLLFRTFLVRRRTVEASAPTRG
jgi:hypothetical protein